MGPHSPILPTLKPLIFRIRILGIWVENNLLTIKREKIMPRGRKPGYKVEEKVDYESSGFDIDMSEMNIPLKEVVEEPGVKSDPIKVKHVEQRSEGTLTNCLRNERIVVRYIPKTSGIWGTNPKHVLAGGMAEGATRTFTVPQLSSGVYVNVLTNDEKAFLEEAMGLEYNALSVHKKNDNFWDGTNASGINKVRLTKGDNYLDLSNPEDYIRYKILLANKDYIAPSLQALQDYPKATYQFVIASDREETKLAKSNMSATMMCYKEFGKVEDDIETLRTIIEIMENKPTAKSSKLEPLQTKINDLIQQNSKTFLKVITDPLLQTKVLIKRSVEEGLIATRGNFLYLRNGNLPLCEQNEEPTLNIAAKYLNDVRHQDVLFALQAKLNQ